MRVDIIILTAKSVTLYGLATGFPLIKTNIVICEANGRKKANDDDANNSGGNQE